MAEPIIKPTNPYFRISEANPLAFILVKEYNNRDTYKNVFNSKSCQANTNVVDGLVQEFHWEDKIKTQFWTNYDTIEVTQTDDEDNVLPISVELKVQNLDIKTAMDASSKPIDNGSKTGIYFESGNTYEYKSSTVNGSYELFGALPEWGVVDNWVFMDQNSSWFQIESVIYDSSISANVLVINTPYVDYSPNQLITSSNYNRFNYNVYEFVINPYDKESMYLNVQLNTTDEREGFIGVSYSSEDIYVNSEYDKNEYGADNKVELVYFNYENSADLYFSTGFYGLLRLDTISDEEGSDSEFKTEKQSKTVLSLSSSNYHEKTLSLDRVPTIMFRKLQQAFAMKEVFIDRIQYTVNEIDSEWDSSTNSYSVTVTLYYAEDGFNPLTDRRYCGDRYINTTLFIEGLFEQGLFN